MATLVHTTEPVDQPTWEIQSDALAPPPTRRIIRGWDRAPVSARAPRLHGQKVWKKVGLKTTNVEDIQDEAQEELEKEGAGARKKSRMLTSRENINDAMWAAAMPDECTKDVGSTVSYSEVQSETNNTPLAPVMDGSNAGIEVPLGHNAPNTAKQDQTIAILQFIPRKRTNTDHVITPQKPLRQSTLDHMQHVPSANEKPNSTTVKTTRPRKSLRKSMIGSISDNASEQTKASKAQTRLSSSAEYLTNIAGATSVVKELEAPVGGFINKRRVLRRSTVSTRRSIGHAEQTSDIEHNVSQPTELGSQVATKSIVPLPANSTTSEEDVVTTTGPDEFPKTDDATTCNISGLDLSLPSDTTLEHERSACLFTHATDSQGPDAVGLRLPEILRNSAEDVKQIKVIPVEEDNSNITGTRHNENADISASQYSFTELQKPHASSLTEEQFVADQDTSNADGGSLAAYVPSPFHTGSTSSLKSEHEVPQTEITVSLEAPAELDLQHDIQGVEAHDVPDSSNLATAYDHDDTDMLRNFLTRVKANKAAKNPPKRKRSLPHSPLRIPLGDLDSNASPSPLQMEKGNELEVAEPSPSKRKKKPSPLAQCENEPEPRRSGRTKPPMKEPPGAPSFIPVRRLGQDVDTTVTLKRNEEKELAALTRVNTRKNKGNALTALEVLAKKSEEKEDPVLRQRLLKEVFDEKMERGRQEKEKKGREKKRVTWAEELAQFQTLTKGKPGESNDDKENEKVVVAQGGEDKKQGAVRVGVRSKAALGMALNGTPAPKRKMRGRV